MRENAGRKSWGHMEAETPAHAEHRNRPLRRWLLERKMDPPLTCQWNNCGELHTPSRLMAHITAEHSAPADVQCHWGECSQKETSKYALVHHIGLHLKHAPLICLVPDCVEQFPNADQLQAHLKARHEQRKDDRLAWFTLLDKFKYASPLDEPRQKKFSGVSDREFHRMLHSRKIDFLKISNVSVDDIVSEPSRKKGRTANAEINADLREQYRVENTEFKDGIMAQATAIFENAQSVESLPTDKVIESMDPQHLEQLYAQLERQWLWSLEANLLLGDQLKGINDDRDELVIKKELLLDSLISMEVPDSEHLYSP